jgi:hypothetical protein
MSRAGTCRVFTGTYDGNAKSPPDRLRISICAHSGARWYARGLAIGATHRSQRAISFRLFSIARAATISIDSGLFESAL